MSILSFLENKLGSLLNWPQDILRYLFYDRSSCFTTRELAAFFYGNDFPVTLHLNFFNNVTILYHNV